MSARGCDACGAPVDAERQGDVQFCSGRPAHPNIRPLDTPPERSRPHGSRDRTGRAERNGRERLALVASPGPVAQVRTPETTKPAIMSAVDLAAMQFNEPKVIVPWLLVEGAMLLVGAGKSGKSRLMLAIAVAVAAGGKALGSIDVERGDVLYLALEDGRRRARARMLAASGGKPPARLQIAVEWPALDAGGLAMLEGWLQLHPDARLIVVDTLKRVRPRTNGQRNAYDVDYEAAAPLNDLAIRHGVCIVVIHHTNKLRLTEDVTDRISGSTGLFAAVDGGVIMERIRGKADAMLGVFHRDLEDARYAIKSDHDIGWRWLGDATEHTRTVQQDEVVNAILAAGRPLKPVELAAALGGDRNVMKQRLWSMSRPNAAGAQILAVVAGHYWPASRPLPEGESDDFSQ